MMIIFHSQEMFQQQFYTMLYYYYMAIDAKQHFYSTSNPNNIAPAASIQIEKLWLQP